MPNIMEYLRLKNLFGQPDMLSNPQVSMGMDNISAPPMIAPKSDPWGNVSFGANDMRSMGDTNIPAPEDYDAGARMRELYTPETKASDKFSELAGSYPNRADYHPSFLRRIGASLTALGQSMGPRGFNPNGDAFNSGLAVLNKPYNDKVLDWKNQIGPAQQSANLERYSNANERSLAYQTVAQELSQRRADATAKNQETKNKIAQDRAEVYRLKSTMPNHEFDFSGPTVLVADKQTGQVQNTGIPTGSLSDTDKIELQQKGKIAAIQETGSQNRQTENTREDNRETLQNLKGWTVVSIPDPSNPTQQIGVRVNSDTGEVRPIQLGGKNVGPVNKPSSSGSKPESPSQTRVRQFNKARELYNTRADLRPFIKIGSPGSSDFTIAPPSKGFFGGATGPTPEQYQELQGAVYGDSAPTMVSSHTPPPATGRVTIYKDDKAVGTIPANQVEEAKRQGYTVK